MLGFGLYKNYEIPLHNQAFNHAHMFTTKVTNGEFSKKLKKREVQTIRHVLPKLSILASYLVPTTYYS